MAFAPPKRSAGDVSSTFYGKPQDYPAMENANTAPIIPTMAAANPAKVVQPVVRVVGKHGHITYQTRTPEEIAMRQSIDHMLEHLNEENGCIISKELNKAEHYKKGPKAGCPKPISGKNLLKISQHARELLNKQIRIQAGFAEREARKAKHSVVSHRVGAWKRYINAEGQADFRKIQQKGAIQKAYGRALRAHQKIVRDKILQGDIQLEGDALLGAQAVATAVRNKYIKKMSKEKGSGATLFNEAGNIVNARREVTEATGMKASSRKRLAKTGPSAAAAAAENAEEMGEA